MKSDIHPNELADHSYRMLTDRTARSAIDRTCYMCGGVIERQTVHRYMAFIAESRFQTLRGRLEAWQNS